MKPAPFFAWRDMNAERPDPVQTSGSIQHESDNLYRPAISVNSVTWHRSRCRFLIHVPEAGYPACMTITFVRRDYVQQLSVFLNTIIEHNTDTLV